MAFEQVAEFGDVQVEPEFAGATFPCPRGQISILEKSTIGLLGQITDRLAERLRINQIRKRVLAYCCISRKRSQFEIARDRFWA